MTISAIRTNSQIAEDLHAALRRHCHRHHADEIVQIVRYPKGQTVLEEALGDPAAFNELLKEWTPVLAERLILPVADAARVRHLLTGATL